MAGYQWTEKVNITTQQTVWPGFPLTLPYEGTAARPSYLPSDYAGMMAPSRMIPYFYNTVIEKPSPKENRIFFLDRSVFDLVDAHPYLALTDPKLLGWYLSLSPEDRKIIQDEGGFHQFLQRHPALELSRHHVYVKYNADNTGSSSPAQPTITSNKHASRTSGAKKCRCEKPQTHLDLQMLPNNVRGTLTLLGCSNRTWNGSRKHSDEEICHTKRLVHLQDSVQTAFNSPIKEEPNHQQLRLNEERLSWQMAGSSSSAAVCRDPASLASFSVDMEPERCSQGGQSVLRSQTAMTHGQSAQFTYAEVNPLQSEWPTIERVSPSEYYSFDSIHMDGTEYKDRSVIPSVELEQGSSPLGPVEENGTNGVCQEHVAYGNDYIVGDDEASLSFEDQSHTFHSIREDDKSILVCLTSEDMKAHINSVHSDPVTTNGEALAASSETVTSDQSVAKTDTAEKYTSPMPGVTTCDMMVGTELALRTPAVTQTEDPATSDKHVITEVHMADLDYLAEEFIKLKMAREQKAKMKSAGCKLRTECDCIQRAQQAELCLLALQYSMCRQHCWRLYYTSAEGGQLTQMPKNPPANIVSVLQKLESDYNQMKDKILAGVPLQQLKPLFVESEKVTTGASYIPAQILGDVLATVPSWSSQEPQKHNTSGEENGCADNQSRNGFQHSQRKEKQIKKEISKVRRAVTLVSQDRDAIRNVHKQEKNQIKLNMSEAWYDAEEDLEPAGPAVAAETGQDATGVLKDKSNESASEEAERSVLCVSNLPSNVTESDVMLWFEKYHPSEVSISALKNDLRVAIVMMSGPQSAEAAARELNGCSMQGRTLHVELINRAIGGSQSRASASISGSSQDATEPQTSKSDSSSTGRKLITQLPLSSSLKNRKVVCISPTAKGTCVPQHYGTMGSFDILMAELTQHHPDAGRQRIVEALMELKAKHQGVLSGLPLRTIREMTSELLTGPEGPTQL